MNLNDFTMDDLKKSWRKVKQSEKEQSTSAMTVYEDYSSIYGPLYSCLFHLCAIAAFYNTMMSYGCLWN